MLHNRLAVRLGEEPIKPGFLILITCLTFFLYLEYLLAIRVPELLPAHVRLSDATNMASVAARNAPAFNLGKKQVFL